MAEHVEPHDEHAAHHDVTKAQHDAPPNLKLIVMVVATCIALGVIVLATVQYFDVSVRAEIDRKVTSQPSAALEQLRQSEQIKLGRYAWVNQKNGVVRIPLDRAIELTLQEWEKRPDGLVDWSDAAAPAPAPATPGTPAPTGTGTPPGTGTTPAPATPAGTPTPGAPQAPPAPTPGKPGAETQAQPQ